MAAWRIQLKDRETKVMKSLALPPYVQREKHKSSWKTISLAERIQTEDKKTEMGLAGRK